MFRRQTDPDQRKLDDDASSRIRERAINASKSPPPQSEPATGGTPVAEKPVKLKDHRQPIPRKNETKKAAPARQPEPTPPPHHPIEAPSDVATMLPRNAPSNAVLFKKAATEAMRKPAPQMLKVLKDQVLDDLLDRVELDKASALPREELRAQITDLASEILSEKQARLSRTELDQLVDLLLDEMLGLGPLEPLLEDETISDILVNGHGQIFVERDGLLEQAEAEFKDDSHVLNIAQRIVAQVGRRIDETSPLVDARLKDGSRVNIIIPPLAIDGPSISIRKFSKRMINLDLMQENGAMSPEMALLLKIAARCRLNVLISGGTGTGKTTLLNAMSEMIDVRERIVTIEDAAELQLMQPHVVRLETRPANLEGAGSVTMRDLVKNALRMRPDRIILGEVRGEEAVDMLQAMNTGHEGSLGTIHANKPREAITRLEQMFAMAGFNLPPSAVRNQIASAIDLVIQVSRMRDGKRRITKIMEVVGLNDGVVVTQDLFVYEITGEDGNGIIHGKFVYTGIPPQFRERARYFGLEDRLLSALGELHSERPDPLA